MCVALSGSIISANRPLGGHSEGRGVRGQGRGVGEGDGRLVVRQVLEALTFTSSN